MHFLLLSYVVHMECAYQCILILVQNYAQYHLTYIVNCSDKLKLSLFQSKWQFLMLILCCWRDVQIETCKLKIVSDRISSISWIVVWLTDKNLDLSSELIKWIGYHKKIEELTFRALVLYQNEFRCWLTKKKDKCSSFFFYGGQITYQLSWYIQIFVFHFHNNTAPQFLWKLTSIFLV